MSLTRQDVTDVESYLDVVDVTITVISIAGLHLRDAAAGSTKGADDTTIVASVSSGGGNPIISQSSPIATSSKKSPAELIRWSSNESFKSIKFREYFKGTKCLLAKCSIDLAISRGGRYYPLGAASLVINGEERQIISTLLVPIDRAYPMKSKLFAIKKNVVPMFKPDGENWKYGLADDATIRLVVQIEAASDDALSLNDESSGSLFSSNTTITEYSLPSTKNDFISVGTLALDKSKPYNVMREISGLTSFWACDNMSSGTDTTTTASGSADEIKTVETIPSTDSDSDPFLNVPDDTSMPSQFGVEVVPYSYRPRVTFGTTEEFTFTAETSETSHRILVTLPSKRVIMNDITDEDDIEATQNGVHQGSRLLTRCLRQCSIN